MFTYFGILAPQSSDEHILAPGIETPRNTIRQKPFFGGAPRRSDEAPLGISKLERDIAVLKGAGIGDAPEPGQAQPPLKFVSLFMPPYV